jgi:hypothetical protein
VSQEPTSSLVRNHPLIGLIMDMPGSPRLTQSRPTSSKVKGICNTEIKGFSYSFDRTVAANASQARGLCRAPMSGGGRSASGAEYLETSGGGLRNILALAELVQSSTQGHHGPAPFVGRQCFKFDRQAVVRSSWITSRSRPRLS